jgi:activator of Hsp90 ATPase-like protein
MGDGIRAMSATAYLSPETTRPRRLANVRARFAQRHIAMRVVVGADRRRIFDALTLPEYIEAWLTLPGDHAGCRLVASQKEEAFRFDHFSAVGYDLSISGAFRVCRRGKMFFSWRKWDARDEHAWFTDSLVMIRLYGAFAKSTLCLAHSGSFSEEDYCWHSEMWERSLKKLQSLFALGD